VIVKIVDHHINLR